MEFSTTTRGNKALIYKGYEYSRFRSNKKGVWSWRCRLAQRSKCPALLKILNDKIVGPEPIHSHSSDPSKAQANLLTARMKVAMKKEGASPKEVIQKVLEGVNPRVLDRLPTHSMISQHLHRSQRQGVVSHLDIPTNLNFKISTENSDYILHDTGPGANRILALGDPDMLKELVKHEVIFGDGTYDTSSKMLFELFTIHAQIGNTHPACVYFLLPNKEQSTYKIMFEILQDLCEHHLLPKEIIIDFDPLCFAAAREVFLASTIKGSYFHMHQTVLKQIKSVGLQVEYNSDADVKLKLKSLSALAFVPPHAVESLFLELVIHFPADDKRYLDVINYFVSTFFVCESGNSGEESEPPVFAMDDWNHYNSALKFTPKTSNCCQHIHNGLNSIFHAIRRQHVWYLLDSVKKDIKKQVAFLREVQADPDVLKTDKCQQLATVVYSIVKGYEEEPDRLAYLRNLANLQ